MKIAVVHNTDKDGIIYRFGKASPEDYGKKTIQLVIDALRGGGHSVASVSGDKNLCAELERFMPSLPDDPSRRPTGMVFNMAYGIQGECRYTHVPAMLEMAGVPYTGSSPLGHALALDKVITKHLIHAAGVPTPAFRVLSGAGQTVDGLRYPLIVKPRHESTSLGLQFVARREQLDAAVAEIVSRYQQEALVEEYIDGREVCIALLGNQTLEFLPPVELDFGGRELRLMTRDDKYHQHNDEPIKLCPAPFDAAFVAEAQQPGVGYVPRLPLQRLCACRYPDKLDGRSVRAGNQLDGLVRRRRLVRQSGFDPGLHLRDAGAAHRRDCSRTLFWRRCPARSGALAGTDSDRGPRCASVRRPALYANSRVMAQALVACPTSGKG